jgi:hypothetical protein
MLRCNDEPARPRERILQRALEQRLRDRQRIRRAQRARQPLLALSQSRAATENDQECA